MSASVLLLSVVLAAPTTWRTLGPGVEYGQLDVEGGPEASLSIRAEGLRLDLSGSYETGFNENDDNRVQWRLPNVLVVMPR